MSVTSSPASQRISLRTDSGYYANSSSSSSSLMVIQCWMDPSFQLVYTKFCSSLFKTSMTHQTSKVNAFFKFWWDSLKCLFWGWCPSAPRCHKRPSTADCSPSCAAHRMVFSFFGSFSANPWVKIPVDRQFNGQASLALVWSFLSTLYIPKIHWDADIWLVEGYMCRMYLLNLKMATIGCLYSSVPDEEVSKCVFYIRWFH